VLDERGLFGPWGYGNQVCCGIGPVVAALRFAKAQGCAAGRTLYFRNSGDDFSRKPRKLGGGLRVRRVCR